MSIRNPFLKTTIIVGLWIPFVGIHSIASAATITIEKIVRTAGNSINDRDPVLTDPAPGRLDPFVFWSESDPSSPVINSAGEVAFLATTASKFGINLPGAARGIYVKRPGFPLAVLVDSTNDGGSPLVGTFAVPGQPGKVFSAFEPPLINDAGDVLFFARYFDAVTFAQGSGFYSTKTTGGPLVKIVDTSDTPAGHPATARFESFTFIANRPRTFGASLNDLGEVVYWGQFCDNPPCTSTTRLNGIFGTSVSGGVHVLLADSSKTICPTGIPFGIACDPALNQGFWEIRPEKGLTNSGNVVFHGKIQRGGGLCCGGVFSVPVSGGPITTVAFRSQPAPPDVPAIRNFGDRFDDVASNESGTVLFSSVFFPSSGGGIYAGDIFGGPFFRVTDSLAGNGPMVPGAPAGSEFALGGFPVLNNAGQVAFRALSTDGTTQTDGIYFGDASGGLTNLVLDSNSPVPGLPAPARLSSFQQGIGPAMNSAGNMAYWGAGLDDQGASLQGMYFFDSCSGGSSRIVDSTTALTELGVAFGGVGGSRFGIHADGAARAGQYRSINNNNDVVFLAKFSNFGYGVYVAHITPGGSRPAVFVDAAATGANDGTSWTDAYNSLQDALLDAASPTCPASAIWVAKGVYRPDQGAAQTAGNRSATFQMLNGVSILGGFAGNEVLGTFDLTTRDFVTNETILNGDLVGDDGPNFANNADNSFHVVTATGTENTARLDGFTITAGNANGASPDQFGGGLTNWRSSGALLPTGPTIANCSLRNNTAQFGGGAISGNGSTITFDNTEFVSNFGSQQGGGMYLSNAALIPTVRNCLFAGNSSFTGGGLYVNQGATVTGCVFTGNVATEVPSTNTSIGGGGGLFTIAVRDSFSLTDSSFSGNVAKRGAALHNSFGGPTNRPRVHNCVFWGNTATLTGNEIFNFGATAFVQNCDIQGSGGSGAGWDVTIGRDDGGNIDADPRFEDANGVDNITGTVDDNLRLSCGSPAIDAGNDLLVPAGNTNDPDGQPRIAGAAVNMGAFESQPTGTGQITITCPADLTLVTALECGGDTSPVTTGTATAVEDCLGASVPTAFTDVSISACGGTETITRTWTAGGSAACNQVITTVDTTAPVLTIPANVTIECAASTDPSNTGQATATDTCDAAPAFTFTDVVTPGTACGQAKTIARTWVATDACGNTASGVQTITVVDSIPPQLTVPLSVVVECGTSTVPSSTGQATATDNCDVAPTLTSSDSIAPGTCPQGSVITRTWTAADACGNSVSATQIITVIDSTPPALTLPANVTVSCDADSSPVATGTATALDNCDAAPLVGVADVATAGVCPQNSVITRTWTTTDACGNTVSAAQTVNVVDSAPPVITLTGAGTVVLAGCVGDAYVELGATAADNCDAGPIAVTVGGATVNTSLPATFTILYDAVDACGNAAAQVTRTVNVVDSAAPTFTSLPADLTVECQGTAGVPATDPAIAAFLNMAAATDACDPIVNITNDAPTTFPFGATTVTWTATDVAGNAFTAFRVVTVTDTTAPLATCPPGITVSADAACQAAIPNVTTGVTASDACSDAISLTVTQSPVAGTSVGLGAHTITVTVVDASGNSGQCITTLTVTDDTAPTVTAPPAATIECDQPSDPSVAGSATAVDNCDPAPSITFTDATSGGLCPELSAVTRTFTATDAAGNTASASQTISIVDTTAPAITCPVVISTSGGFGGTVVTFAPAAADACDPTPSVTSAPPSGSFFVTGVTAVSATAADTCANAGTCGFNVLVSCFGVNRAKIGTKDQACRGVESIEFTSMNGTEELISFFKAVEGSGGGVQEDTLPASIVVDDGVNGPVTVDTSCGVVIQIGDVFGPYTVSDIDQDFDDLPEAHGNDVKIRGTFVPAVPFDLAVDDFTISIDDGQGNVASFTVPAGSFVSDGNPAKGKFKFEGNIGVADIKVKLKGCKVEFKAKNATNTAALIGTVVTVRLAVGPNLGEDTLVMQDKGNHLKFKRRPKVNCCPSCKGVASMQVTSDQGVLVFVPDAGKMKLHANTVVDDGVNGPVTIHTSCSQPIDVGDTFGPYTVSEVIKVFNGS